MKHPHLSTLQDYFENELNSVQSSLVKDHLLNCDSCTGILAQMAKVDTSARRTQDLSVSPNSRERLFADAKNLLAQKRLKIAAEESLATGRAQAREELVQATAKLWRDSLDELRIPALQLASVSFVVAILIVANRDVETTIYKPFSEEVVVGTHADHDAPLTSGDSQ